MFFYFFRGFHLAAGGCYLRANSAMEMSGCDYHSLVPLLYLSFQYRAGKPLVSCSFATRPIKELKTPMVGPTALSFIKIIEISFIFYGNPIFSKRSLTTIFSFTYLLFYHFSFNVFIIFSLKFYLPLSYLINKVKERLSERENREND